MEEFFDKVMDDNLTHAFDTSYQEVIDLVKQKGVNNCWTIEWLDISVQ